MSWDASQWFYLALLVVSVTLSLVAFTLLWIRRDKFPIRERKPWTVLLSTGSLTIVSVMMCVREIMGGDIDCFPFWVVYSIFNTFLFATIVLRGSILIISFNLTQGALEFHQSMVQHKEQMIDHLKGDVALEEKSSNWFLSRRRYFSAKYLIPLFSLAVVILCLPILLFFAVNQDAVDSSSTSDQCIGHVYIFRYVDLPFGALMLVAFLIGHQKLKAVREQFYIKEELQHLGMVLVCIAVLISVLVTLDHFGRENGNSLMKDIADFIFAFVRYVALLVWVLWISIFQIVYVSYEIERRDLEKIKKISDLDDIVPNRASIEVMRSELLEMLEDGEGYSVFLKVVEQQFSVENLLFWKDVIEFKRMTDPSFISHRLSELSDDKAPSRKVTKSKATRKEIQDRAVSIFKTYVAEDAMLLVNLSHAQFEGLRSSFAKIFGRGNATRMSRAFSGKVVAGPVMNAPLKRTRSEKATMESSLEIPEVVEVEDPMAIGSHTFDDALGEITNLMCTDSFRRFRLTPGYREYRLKCRKKLIQASVKASREGLKSQLVSE